MKNILLLLSVSGALLVSSCSNGDSGSSNANDENTSSSNRTEEVSKRDSKVGSCLEKYDYDYAKILTLDDIVLHHNVDGSGVETEVSPSKDSYGSVVYSWPSDRPEVEFELLGQLIKTADENRVELKQLSFHDDASPSTTHYFAGAYKKLSEEEIAALYANVEKTYAGKPKELEQAKVFIDMRRNSKYTEIPGLGTLAYWKWDDRYGGELVTLVGKTQFAVTAKVSDNADADLEAAKKLAKEVINKCL